MDRNKNTLIPHEILLLSFFLLRYQKKKKKKLDLTVLNVRPHICLIKIAPNTLTNKSKSMFVSNRLSQCLNVPFFIQITTPLQRFML